MSTKFPNNSVLAWSLTDNDLRLVSSDVILKNDVIIYHTIEQLVDNLSPDIVNKLIDLETILNGSRDYDLAVDWIKYNFNTFVKKLIKALRVIPFEYPNISLLRINDKLNITYQEVREYNYTDIDIINGGVICHEKGYKKWNMTISANTLFILYIHAFEKSDLYLYYYDGYNLKVIATTSCLIDTENCGICIPYIDKIEVISEYPIFSSITSMSNWDKLIKKLESQNNLNLFTNQ